jgi:hypothetical protein
MSRFAPKPKNDFAEFYELYYATCRERVPCIAAIAAKWLFEDLIPGLSDFDTRFILEDGMTVDDWCAMSEAVGEVHLDLCNRYPHWARNLEHLPGINLTWAELTDREMYYPEYAQWTFYYTEDADRLAAAQRYLQGRPWEQGDEYFHLKKFCLYYGRYNRQIDPPINLGAFENKYAMHSRIMHYFCPPVQAALCLLLRRPIAGKLETLRQVHSMFPDPVFGEVLEIIERHYEVPELYEEPELSRFEDRLEQALETLRQALAPHLTTIRDAAAKSIAEWKAELHRVPISPAIRVIDAARFSRLMKGRLRFYAHAPAHFDSIWLIENELKRLKASFFDVPFGTCWEVLTGETMVDAATILPQLYPAILNEHELACSQEFVRLLPGQWKPGQQKHIALELAAIFDGFYSALTKVSAAVAPAGKG